MARSIVFERKTGEVELESLSEDVHVFVGSGRARRREKKRSWARQYIEMNARGMRRKSRKSGPPHPTRAHTVETTTTQTIRRRHCCRFQPTTFFLIIIIIFLLLREIKFFEFQIIPPVDWMNFIGLEIGRRSGTARGRAHTHTKKKVAVSRLLDHSRTHRQQHKRNSCTSGRKSCEFSRDDEIFKSNLLLPCESATTTTTTTKVRASFRFGGSLTRSLFLPRKKKKNKFSNPAPEKKKRKWIRAKFKIKSEIFPEILLFNRNRKTQPKRFDKKNKGKGGKRRETKNSARPSRTHNNNTLSSAHATAGTLQGRRRTRHTHTSSFIFFIFFFYFFISWVFLLFFSACSRWLRPFPHARASTVGRGWGGPPFTVCGSFVADRSGSPDRIPSSFFFLLFIHWLIWFSLLLASSSRPSLSPSPHPPPRLCPFFF